MELCPSCLTDATTASHRCRDCRRRCHATCGASASVATASLVVCKPCARTTTSISETVATADGSRAKRKKQHVVTIGERQQVIRWLMDRDAEGGKHARDEAIKRFSPLFQGSKCANTQKLKTWWDDRAALLQDADTDDTVTGQSHLQQGGRLEMKARAGRGRKRSEWVSWLYPKLDEECQRLQGRGVEVTSVRIGETARSILKSSTEKFNARSVDKDGALILDKVTTRWIQSFRKAFGMDNAGKNPRKKPRRTEPTGSAKSNQELTSTAQAVHTQAPTTTTPSSTNPEAAFLDDVESFPYHAAVRESDGELTNFRELIDVVASDADDPMRAMAMQVGSTTSSQEFLCAAEYAYAVGYREVGEYFLNRMMTQSNSVHTLEPAPLNRSPVVSVELRQSVDDFPYVCVVVESRGDVDECELLCEVVDEEDYAVDARIQAQVVRDRTKSVSWSAVEYAGHLGYVDIVKYLLKEKCRSMAMTTKIQLLKQAHQNSKSVGKAYGI